MGDDACDLHCAWIAVDTHRQLIELRQSACHCFVEITSTNRKHIHSGNPSRNMQKMPRFVIIATSSELVLWCLVVAEFWHQPHN